MVNRDLLEQRAKLDLLDPPESRVIVDHRVVPDLKDPLDNQDHKVQLDKLVRLALRVTAERQVLRDRRVRLASRARKVSRVKLEVRATAVELVPLEQPDRPEVLDRLVQLVQLVMPDPRVRSDQWARLELPEPRERRDILGLPAPPASRDRLDSKARRVLREIREQLETLVHPVHWDQLEMLDLRVRKDHLGHRVRPVTLETLDPREARAPLDLRDFQESMVQQAQLVHLAAQDRKVRWEQQDPLVAPGQQVLQDKVEIVDKQDQPEQQGRLDQSDHVVILVPLVSRETPDRQGHLEEQDSREPQVQLDRLDSRDTPDLKGQLEQPEIPEAKDNWDCRELLEQLDHLALADCRETLDQQVKWDQLVQEVQTVSLELLEQRDLPGLRESLEIADTLATLVIPDLLATKERKVRLDKSAHRVCLE